MTIIPFTLNNFRAGELGAGFSLKSGNELYQQGLYRAENIDTSGLGNIRQRGGFAWAVSGDMPDMQIINDNCALCSFRVRTDAGMQNRQVIMSGDYAYVFSVDHSTTNLSYLCKVEIPEDYRACIHLCSQTSYIAPNHEVPHGICFAHHKVKPFSFLWSGDAIHPNDFKFTEFPLINLPRIRVDHGNNDEKTFAELGTGDVTIGHSGSIVTISVVNDVFTQNEDYYKGQRIENAYIGRFEINKKQDNKTLICTPIVDTNTYGTFQHLDDFIIQFNWEPIADDSKGWFDCCAFFQSRMWFAGCRSNPGYVIGSNTDDIADFGFYTGLDSDGCCTRIGEDVRISALGCGSTLHVLTSGENAGIWVPSVGANGIITPNSFELTKISNGSGGDPYTQVPQTKQFGNIAIDSTSSNISYISYENAAQSYTSIDLTTLLPSDLIQQHEDVTYSFCLVQSQSAKESGTQALYFINKQHQIVKMYLTLYGELSPSFTRYIIKDDNNNITNTKIFPIKLFTIMHKIYGIFKDINDNSFSILRLEDYAMLDFSVQCTSDDTGKFTLPKFYPKFGNNGDIPVCVYNPVTRERKRAVVNVDGDNRYVTVPDFTNTYAEIGLPFDIKVVTMELVQKPGGEVYPEPYKPIQPILISFLTDENEKMYRSVNVPESLRYSWYEWGNQSFDGELVSNILQDSIGEEDISMISYTGPLSVCVRPLMAPKLVLTGTTPCFFSIKAIYVLAKVPDSRNKLMALETK